MAKVRLPLVPYIGSVVEESKKVVWPDRDTVTKHTIMVVVTVLISMLIFGSIDFGLKELVKLAIAS